jgi:hypothetical protein
MSSKIEMPTEAQSERRGYVETLNKGRAKRLNTPVEPGETVGAAFVKLKVALSVEQQATLEQAIVAAFPEYLEEVVMVANALVEAVPGEEADENIVGRQHNFVIEARLRCDPVTAPFEPEVL